MHDGTVPDTSAVHSPLPSSIAAVQLARASSDKTCTLHVVGVSHVGERAVCLPRAELHIVTTLGQLAGLGQSSVRCTI